MALEEVAKRLSGKGGWVAVGIGAAVLAPILIKKGRPLAKKAMAGCSHLAERTGKAFSCCTQQCREVFSEAKAEYEAERAPTGTPPALPMEPEPPAGPLPEPA